MGASIFQILKFGLVGLRQAFDLSDLWIQLRVGGSFSSKGTQTFRLL